MPVLWSALEGSYEMIAAQEFPSCCHDRARAFPQFVQVGNGRLKLNREDYMSTILLIILILLLLGAIPAWPYSADWGYGPSGGIGLILLILIILLLLGKI